MPPRHNPEHVYDALGEIKSLRLVGSYDEETRRFRIAYSYGPLAGGRGAQERQTAWQEQSARYADSPKEAEEIAHDMARTPQVYS